MKFFSYSNHRIFIIQRDKAIRDLKIAEDKILRLRNLLDGERDFHDKLRAILIDDNPETK